MKILVPNDVSFDCGIDLDDPADTVVGYASTDPIPDEHADAEVLVVWNAPFGVIGDAARRMTSLEWVQTLAAGPDAVLAAGFADSVVISSGRGLHDGPVAEHAFALILASVRRIDRSLAAQGRQVWDGSMVVEQASADLAPTFTLAGARITIWGFGAIAAALAPHLRALGAVVTGVARSAGQRHGFEVVAEADLDTLLPTTDILVSILPAMPETSGALSADVLAKLPSHARFINVGRGSTVDEQALVAALVDGRLAGAAIDVASTEPLPPGSPLWTAPNLILTPHVAGGRPQGVREFLSAQVRAWKSAGAAGIANRVA
ncbi:MAG: NAD(P)-dependent oxidoreductase [Marmoricola sp.]